jgi:hypothetical protein
MKGKEKNSTSLPAMEVDTKVFVKGTCTSNCLKIHTIFHSVESILTS